MGHLVAHYAIVALVGVLGGFIAARYVGQSVGRAVLSTVALELTLAVAEAWATWSLRGDIRVMWEWTQVEGEALEALRERTAAVVLGFPQRFEIAAVGRVLLFTPATACLMFGYSHGHLGRVTVFVAIGSLFVILYGGVLGYFGGELGWRPLREETGRTMPRSEFLGAGTLSLRLKLIVGLIGLCLVLSFMVASLVVPAGGSFGTVSRAVWITLLLVPTLGLSVVVPLMRSILGPVQDLIAGTDRVARGELDHEVPITSTDELGELAVSFNEMMNGLREREILREHNATLVDELRASRERIVTAADAERRSIERDLHDGAQQHLVLLNLKLGLAQRQIAQDPASAEDAFGELRTELDRALAQLRDLAHGIYPTSLENDGLPGALRDAVERAAIPTTLEFDGTSRYPPELEAAIYFCCLEALQNASKHGGENATATVRLGEHDGALAFAVTDTGPGFDVTSATTSTGLQNMTDRIGALGGDLTITSSPGQGTRVTGTIPLAA